MTEACDMEGLQEILKIARKKNALLEITGLLCYDPAFFLQCLEGPRAAVNELYNTILQDARHQEVMLLEYVEAQQRIFPDWSMAFISAQTIDPALLEAYKGAGKFDPYTLSAQTGLWLSRSACGKRTQED